MLSNCEKKMVVISSTTNEWPQNRVDEKDLMESSASRVMEKPSQQQQQQQEALKCPRCDSSNTKFCYYNNYSLSQPRHFCKACKRYWTRGGTLRNVPVGGGCRKNKRVTKRPASAIGGGGASPTNYNNNSGGANPPHPISQPININPLFNYGDMNNLSFPRVNSTATGGGGSGGGGVYNHLQQPHQQLNPIGLWFSTSNPLLSSSYNINTSNIFGSSSSSSTTTTTPTIASLLASTFQQHKFMSNTHESPVNNYNFQTLPSFQDLQMGSENGVKVEEGAWNNTVACQNNQVEQIGLSDPAVYWNGNWHDPSNIASSLSSFI